MQRARRSSHSSSDYSIDDGNEMEAMAKVWAHPEDLHLFPVSADRTAASLICQPKSCVSASLLVNQPLLLLANSCKMLRNVHAS